MRYNISHILQLFDIFDIPIENKSFGKGKYFFLALWVVKLTFWDLNIFFEF
jgi:hypothetical protein